MNMKSSSNDALNLFILKNVWFSTHNKVNNVQYILDDALSLQARPTALKQCKMVGQHSDIMN